VLNWLILSSGILGFCLAGTTGMIYTILATTFPPGLRASGMGFVMGVMRIASAFGPALAGVMFAHGMTRTGVSLVFAVGPLVASVLIATLPKRTGI
jgi:AAHS family 4-hydroxybenzoate transporter-like MFS transporter